MQIHVLLLFYEVHSKPNGTDWVPQFSKNIMHWTHSQSPCVYTQKKHKKAVKVILSVHVNANCQELIKSMLLLLLCD